MASASNPTSTTTRPLTTTTTATTTAAKSPTRPQTPLTAAVSSTSFPIYHMYPPSQNIPIRPALQTQTQTLNPPSSQSHQQGIIYPVASSGRGFMARPVRHPPDQTVTIANNNPNFNHQRGVGVGVAFRPTSIGASLTHHHSDSSLGLAHNHHHSHPAYHPLHLMRQHPTYSLQLHHPQHHHHILPPIKGIPVTAPLKAASSPLPVSDSNGYKNMRDRSREDNVVIIRDRKVKISDGASLYAICRSWLRNGFQEENQSHYGDFVKVLPRPLPISTEKEDEQEEEYEEDEESVDNLSAQDLLRRHIKRAKKVRARLRERRLKRIARYKTRLAMLLPPQVEQFRNDTAAGN